MAREEKYKLSEPQALFFIAVLNWFELLLQVSFWLVQNTFTSHLKWNKLKSSKIRNILCQQATFHLLRRAYMCSTLRGEPLDVTIISDTKTGRPQRRKGKTWSFGGFYPSSRSNRKLTLHQLLFWHPSREIQLQFLPRATFFTSPHYGHLLPSITIDWLPLGLRRITTIIYLHPILTKSAKLTNYFSASNNTRL